MTSAALLIAYAVTAGTWGAGWLHEAQWTRRSPRLAIASWQALAASVLLGVAAAGLALAVTIPHVREDLARLLHLCAEGLRMGYATPGGAPAALLGVTVFLGVATRVSWCALRAVRSDRRERRNRVEALDVVGHRDLLPGALVIDYEAPYAFCVGGREHRVVVTSGLLRTLSREELDAVLAHEQAHLRQRHHVALLSCQILFATLAPFFPAFRQSMVDVRLYAELCADDSARARVGSTPLRTALAALAMTPAPTGALAASGTDVVARLDRLESGAPQIGHLRQAAVALGIATLVAVPLGLALAPALTMAWEGICLLG